MYPKKQPLRRDRIRRLPREGWSWIDRRFLREQAPDLDHDAILLYFFLAAVGDKHGLSFWNDATIAGRLRMMETSVERARGELERRDLIAYQRPLYQVLSLPERVEYAPQANPASRGGSALPIGEILEGMLKRRRDG